MASAAIAASDALRTLLRVAGESDFDLDLDTVFEFGLPRLLDGLEIYFAAR